MNRHFTAVIKQDGRWWIGWAQEISGVNCQGKTRAELLKNLRSALKEALEFKGPYCFNLKRREAKRYMPNVCQTYDLHWKSVQGHGGFAQGN